LEINLLNTFHDDYDPTTIKNLTFIVPEGVAMKLRRYPERLKRYLVVITLILFSIICFPKSNTKEISQEELPKILEKTAHYCEKLKIAVFHFYCIEKVAETILGSPEYRGNKAGLKNFIDLSKKNTRLSTFETWDNITRWKAPTPFEPKSKTNLYSYDYQIIKENNKIREQRLLKKANGKKVKTRTPHPQTILYSYKNAITPIYLLSKQNQNKFLYRLVENERIMGRKSHKISIHSKLKENSPDHPVSIVWVDAKDFTVLKAQIYPDAIKGYDKLLKLDKFKISGLKIHDMHTFGYLRKGIRYPTKTEIRLTYKKKAQQLLGYGGYIYKNIQTKVQYKKYTFFNVTVENVTFKDIK
jgi:hypothetical protein